MNITPATSRPAPPALAVVPKAAPVVPAELVELAAPVELVALAEPAVAVELVAAVAAVVPAEPVVGDSPLEQVIPGEHGARSFGGRLSPKAVESSVPPLLALLEVPCAFCAAASAPVATGSVRWR